MPKLHQNREKKSLEIRKPQQKKFYWYAILSNKTDLSWYSTIKNKSNDSTKLAIPFNQLSAHRYVHKPHQKAKTNSNSFNKKKVHHCFLCTIPIENKVTVCAEATPQRISLDPVPGTDIVTSIFQVHGWKREKWENHFERWDRDARGRPIVVSSQRDTRVEMHIVKVGSLGKFSHFSRKLRVLFFYVFVGVFYHFARKLRAFRFFSFVRIVLLHRKR